MKQTPDSTRGSSAEPPSPGAPSFARVFKWLGPALALTSVIAALGFVEIGLRVALDDQQQQHLPHFGLSGDMQARLAWLDWQARRDKYGTTSYPSSFDEPDPELGWRIKPDVEVLHVKPGIYEVDVTTNNRGMRGLRPVRARKRAGTTRVGVFGCSQTFGETVNDEETYVSVLDERVDAAQFLNFGVRGYGTDQMLLYYENDADAYDLDVVVLGFAFYHMKRNDSGFLFYAKPYFTLDEDGELELSGLPVPTPEQLEAEVRNASTWRLADNSVLMRWLWQKVRNLGSPDLYSETGDAWALTGALIERFADSASAAGSRVVVMNIDEGHPELEDDLQALTDELGVGLVNLGPVLRAAGERGVPYTLPADNHWNAEGHRIVADTLEQYLCTETMPGACERGQRAGDAQNNPDYS